MLTPKQKSQIKERFIELKGKLEKLVNARNDFEKPELGKNRNWKRITGMMTDYSLDKTNRMKPLQYDDCFVCEVMNKQCPIWGVENAKDCPELLFSGFCWADPRNDPNDFKTHGLFKSGTMHRRCLLRLAILISEKGVDFEVVKPISRYCQHYCPSYQKCIKIKTAYDRYLLCESTFEKHLLEAIDDTNKIIEMCSK